jgi:hypothetical protein
MHAMHARKMAVSHPLIGEEQQGYRANGAISVRNS